jgi:hypothetical protein
MVKSSKINKKRKIKNLTDCKKIKKVYICNRCGRNNFINGHALGGHKKYCGKSIGKNKIIKNKKNKIKIIINKFDYNNFLINKLIKKRDELLDIKTKLEIEYNKALECNSDFNFNFDFDIPLECDLFNDIPLCDFIDYNIIFE